MLDVCTENSDNKDQIEPQNENDDKTGLNFIYKIYELKTSRLFQASLCAGAILAGAEDDQVAAMNEAAYCIGEAFQIKDDILDTTADFEKLGKDIGSDAKNNKNTVASILGIEKAQELVENYLDRAKEQIMKQSGNKAFFNDLIEYLRSRDR